MNFLRSPLPKPWNFAHQVARLLLLASFVGGMTIFGLGAFFPDQWLRFDFSTPDSKKNSLERPRVSEEDFRGNGQIRSGENFRINATLPGRYSEARIELSIAEGKNALDGIAAFVRSGHRAMFFPEGDPASFPSGTLLVFDSNYALITTDGTRKVFPSESSVRAFGYDPASFLAVSESEFFANADGGTMILSAENISADALPPSGGFVRDGENFYEVRDGTLFPFVSKNAYLARYPEDWALFRSSEILSRSTQSEEWIGFPSGSLLGWANGVFLMDGTSPRPVLNPEIFLSLGYSWEDVVPVSDEEISLERKGKFVTFGNPHPNGTVIYDTDHQLYFLILDGKRRSINGPEILRMWLGTKQAVEVSFRALDSVSFCTFRPTRSFFGTTDAICTLPIDVLIPLSGDTYEFTFSPRKDIDLSRADILFVKKIDRTNIHETIERLRLRVLARYSGGI